MKKGALFFFVFFVNILLAEARYIHVLVALCDNVNQGIVKVPVKIGNGQDPANNLYWGCAFGVKTFLAKQTDWKIIKQQKNPTITILERVIFKHKTQNVFLIADAYNGANIKETTIDLLNFAAGKNAFSIVVEKDTIKAGGSANLIAYVGHNGLMDFSVENTPTAANSKKREVIILACASKNYFAKAIQQAGAVPLLWSTHLMSPEAYTLDAAIDGWLLKESAKQIRERAAMAYNSYQKCGIKGARNLIVTGF